MMVQKRKPYKRLAAKYGGCSIYFGLQKCNDQCCMANKVQVYRNVETHHLLVQLGTLKFKWLACCLQVSLKRAVMTMRA